MFVTLLSVKIKVDDDNDMNIQIKKGCGWTINFKPESETHSLFITWWWMSFVVHSHHTFGGYWPCYVIE